MNIIVDIVHRKLVVNHKPYSLDRLEEYILRYWTPLATANFTKAIQSEGEVKYTYDWNKIFDLAISGGIIIAEFLEREGGFTNGRRFLQPDLFD